MKPLARHLDLTCTEIGEEMVIQDHQRKETHRLSALVALVLTQALPFFFLSGLLMTPDAPLTAAWAASLYYLERALVAGRSGAWWRAGLSLGIGAISKYSIGLLVPVTLAFMLWDHKSRHRWWRWEPAPPVRRPCSTSSSG